MTIKDVEKQTGITKANIRYYESQGLIQPGRSASGYRDYCPEDVEELNRVRLLRLLDVPMEQVKALQQGKTTLDAVLSQQLSQTQAEQGRLDDVAQIIRQIRQNGEDYQSLEPEPYLERLKGRQTQDALISDRHPWRRFWARGVDGVLILAIAFAAFPGLWLQLRAGWNVLFVQWVVLALYNTALEPLLLWAVGWTPGKLLLGIRVTNRNGGRLTFQQATDRTINVLIYGLAFHVPLLKEARIYDCLGKAEDGELLPWEQDTQLVFRKVGVWKHTLVVLIYLLSVVSILWVGFRQVC